jgi:hypothetical protein
MLEIDDIYFAIGKNILGLRSKKYITLCIIIQKNLITTECKMAVKLLSLLQSPTSEYLKKKCTLKKFPSDLKTSQQSYSSGRSYKKKQDCLQDFYRYHATMDGGIKKGRDKISARRPQIGPNVHRTDEKLKD